MLFKILHGDASRISTDITPYHEGYCYVTHSGDFYVDMNNERVKLNAKDAETLTGKTLDEILSSSQADWGINDETDSAYVKNRTHWVETTQNKTQLCTYSFTNSTINTNGFCELNVSDKTESLDDTELRLIYESPTQSLIYDCEYVSGQGVPKWKNVEHGIDVARYIVNVDRWIEVTGLPDEVIGESTNTITLIFYKVEDVEIVNQLDEKFIPNTIARTSDIASDIEVHNTATDAHTDLREEISAVKETADNAAKLDLSNVDNAVFASKAKTAGVGGVPVGMTSGNGAAYTLTLDGVTELYNGLEIIIIPHVNSAAYAPTLNVNGLGAYPIKRSLSSTSNSYDSGVDETWVKKGRAIKLLFNPNKWIATEFSKPVAEDLSGTVPIIKGGTDASTADDARSNLNAAYRKAYTTTGDGAAYEVTVPGITLLEAGIWFVIKPHTESTTTQPTLNVNGLGAATMYRYTTDGTGTLKSGNKTGWLTGRNPVRVCYSGAGFWIITDMPKPSANDIEGTVGVYHGGTGATTLAAGSYLVGNGANAVQTKTPAEVLTDIGAASTDSPAFTGTPTAPTAAEGDNSTQVATTAFVNTAIDSTKSTVANVTLSASSWTGSAAPYTYNVTVSGHDNITDFVELIVGDSMTADQIAELQQANIVKAEWSNNTTLVLYAYNYKPTINTPIKIIIRKDV